MTFFKRIEVWVLLALAVAVVVAVMRMDQADDGVRMGSGTEVAHVAGEGQGGDQTMAAATRNRIESLRLERDGDFAVVEVVVKVEAAALAENARLVREDGSEVEEFFVPFRAGMAAPVTSLEGEDRRSLLFWADRQALAGAMFLEIDGERLPVKAADGFDLDSIDDGGRKVLAALDRGGVAK